MKKLLFILSVVLLGSCNQPTEFAKAQESKQATQVVNHNVESIIIETLHSGELSAGIHKVTVNDSNSFVVVSTYNGVTITKIK